eukprot:2693849-Pyramimonas_sp.AAC.1
MWFDPFLICGRDDTPSLSSRLRSILVLRVGMHDDSKTLDRNRQDLPGQVRELLGPPHERVSAFRVTYRRPRHALLTHRRQTR